ncbi:MAG: hypothetical protein ACRDYB_02495 [Acidimicrobiales bacterium]
MNDEHNATGQPESGDEALALLRERAERFAGVLDGARSRTDDLPGDEVDLVDVAPFGLRVVATTTCEIEVGLIEGPPEGPTVRVVWSAGNRFWHVVGGE